MRPTPIHAAVATLLAFGHASVGQIITEDFSASLGSEWTSTSSDGGSIGVSGGQLEVGISATNGNSGYITQEYDNTGTNYSVFETSFVMDPSSFDFVPGPGIETAFIYQHDQGAANGGPLAALQIAGFGFGSDAYRFWLTGQVHFDGSAGPPSETPNIPSADLEAVTRLGITITETYVNTGGLDWDVSLEAVGTDLDAATQLFTVSRTFSGTALNTAYDPANLSGTGAHRFSFGNLAFSDSADVDLGVPLTYTLDDVVVTGVPEPSAYAAVIGLLALAYAVHRRRRR